MATIWYSTKCYVDINVLRRYPFLLIKFDNLLFRLFHTFGCKQTVSKMLTNSSAFAILGEAHGGHSVGFIILHVCKMLAFATVNCSWHTSKALEGSVDIVHILSPSPSQSGSLSCVQGCWFKSLSVSITNYMFVNRIRHRDVENLFVDCNIFGFAPC